MLEIEMKFPVEDFGPVLRVLETWTTGPGQQRTDADRYFNAPDRDFARTDEALRIRSIGRSNVVTYKGPKTDPLTKTRTEIEVPLGDGPEVVEQFTRLLTHLGYRVVAQVEKRRILYHGRRGGFDLEVCLDDVAGLGRFVELEILAQEQELGPAREALFAAAAELGLKDSERRSYLELLLEQRK